MLSVLSRFRPKASSRTFRICWRGYDPEQVDQFLRQTVADRQRLEEDLAQLEAIFSGQSEDRRREFERLTKLRIEVASCLESSIGALRTATDVLAKAPAAPAYDPAVPRRAGERAGRDDRRVVVGFKFPAIARPAWLSAERKRPLVAAALALTLIPATLFYRSSGEEAPKQRAPAGAPVAPLEASTQPSSAAPIPASAVAEQPEALVIALTANRQCWVRTQIDGGQRLERLLRAGETIMLRANDEAVLRVGDASALSLLINNRIARPLGASGEVVTARITRSNYLGLLAESAT
jgi:DivIVA domain-containing protein